MKKQLILSAVALLMAQGSFAIPGKVIESPHAAREAIAKRTADADLKNALKEIEAKLDKSQRLSDATVKALQKYVSSRNDLGVEASSINSILKNLNAENLSAVLLAIESKDVDSLKTLSVVSSHIDMAQSVQVKAMMKLSGLAKTDKGAKIAETVRNSLDAGKSLEAALNDAGFKKDKTLEDLADCKF